MKTRKYISEEDYLLMQNLIRENYLKSDVRLYPSPLDLDYWRYIHDETPDGIENTQLWFDDNDKILAFAWINEDGVDFVCHYQHKHLLNDIIEWTENEKLICENKNIINCLYLFDCDKESELIAQSRGYKKSQIFNYYGKRSLLEEIPNVQLPYGYIIKHLETDEEIARRAKMNILAGKDVTVAKYRYFMDHASNYRQELDLIVVTLNGEVAGYCTCWYDEKCQMGLFEPYAISFEHMRKGLGKSLLYEGMKRLSSLGCKNVYVSHAGLSIGESNPALALNKSVGFLNVSNNFMWVKTLDKKRWSFV